MVRDGYWHGQLITSSTHPKTDSIAHGSNADSAFWRLPSKWLLRLACQSVLDTEVLPLLLPSSYLSELQ